MRLFYLITVFLSCTVKSFSYTGRRLSDHLENTLHENGVKFETLSPAPFSDRDFPENIVIKIPSKNEEPDSHTRISNAVFCFTQEFFQENPVFFMDLINITEEKNLSYGVTFLFSADRETRTLSAKEKSRSFVDCFLESNGENQESCAVVFINEKHSSNFIVSEGASEISPQWLVQSIKESASKSSKKISSKGALLYLYKSSAFSENTMVSSFLENEIPAAGVPVGISESDMEFILTLEDTLDTSRSDVWNRHYNNLTIGFTDIWLNESILTALYLLIITFSLFSICFTSFINTGSNVATIKDFSRAWYLIPIYITIASCTFFFFQEAFSFTDKNPIVFFAMKLFPSLFTLFLIIVFQIIMKFKVSYSAFTILKNTVCILNIFVFTTIDITLMFIFFTEYLIVFLFRKSKNSIVNIISFLLMILPFAYLFSEIYLYVDDAKLLYLMKTSFRETFLLSLMVTPFVFKWGELLLANEVIDTKKGFTKSQTLRGISTTLCAMAFLASSYAAVFHMLSSEKNMPKTKYHIIESEREIVDITSSDKDNIDLLSRKISISAKNGLRAERYEVSIESLDGIPLYECNFDYESKGANSVRIIIPDQPEGTVDISYSLDYGVGSILTVDAYIHKDMSFMLHKKTTVTIGGGSK